jgi:hypothetical protein
VRESARHRSSHPLDAKFKNLTEKEREEVMKTRVLLMTGLFALTILAASPVVHAQEVMRADIPFNFVAGGRTLPAGEYSVRRFNPMDGSNIMLLTKPKDTSAAAVISTNVVEARTPQSRSKLVFHRYGENYFLSQIWTEGQTRGRALWQSPAEREVAKVAKAETKGEVIVMARLTSAHQ